MGAEKPPRAVPRSPAHVRYAFLLGNAGTMAGRGAHPEQCDDLLPIESFAPCLAKQDAWEAEGAPQNGFTDPLQIEHNRCILNNT